MVWALTKQEGREAHAKLRKSKRTRTQHDTRATYTSHVIQYRAKAQTRPAKLRCSSRRSPSCPELARHPSSCACDEHAQRPTRAKQPSALLAECKGNRVCNESCWAGKGSWIPAARRITLYIVQCNALLDAWSVRYLDMPRKQCKSTNLRHDGLNNFTH